MALRKGKSLMSHCMDDKQPIDILANVYQKIVLKLGEIQPLIAGEKKPKVRIFERALRRWKDETTMAKLVSPVRWI